MMKIKKLILKMLSTQNLYLNSLSEDENKLLKKGLKWYGHFIASIKLVFDNNLPAPAAATVDRKKLKPIIYINEKEFYKFTIPEQIAVLKHEVLHILNEHLTRQGDKNPELFNIAADISINQLIPFIPKDGLHLKNINKELKLSMKEDMPAEYYYNELSKKMENKKCNKIASYKTIDDHSKWKELSLSEQQIIKENLESLIKETNAKSIGDIPNEINNIIKLMNEKNQISWKKQLKKILSNKKANKVKTIKRRNKRFRNRLDLKGNKKDFKGEILVVIDVSGSMNNEEIQKGLNEVIYIIKNMNYKVHLIQVDTEAIYYPEGEKDLKKLKFKRKKSGGTYLFPAIELAKELNLDYSSIIFITDGYIESISTWKYIPKKPIFFLLTDNYWNKKTFDANNYKNMKTFNLINK